MRRIKIRFVVAALSAILLAQAAVSSEAGLQSAILTAYDEIEASNRARVFVAPLEGNDAHLEHSSGPRLMYDPISGALSAEIPAVVIEPLNLFGPASLYTKLYSLQSATIGNFFPSDVPPLKQTSYIWKHGIGALETLEHAGFFEIDHVACDPVDLCGSMTLVWPLKGRVVAAIVDFGQVLPSGLSNIEVRQRLVQDGMSSAFVDYANHRGVATLRVPMSLHVIPEPASAILAVTTTFLVLWHGRRRRRSPPFRLSNSSW